jgi:hypothetical protein
MSASAARYAAARAESTPAWQSCPPTARGSRRLGAAERPIPRRAGE